MLVDCSPVAKLHPFRPLMTPKPRSVLLVKAHKLAAALEHKSFCAGHVSLTKHIDRALERLVPRSGAKFLEVSQLFLIASCA